MKKLLSLTMVVLSFNTMACLSYDLEFIGVVRNVLTQGDVCTYQVTSTQYWENSECPLSPGEVDSALLVDSTCSLKNGDKISGIASKKGEVITIDQ